MRRGLKFSVCWRCGLLTWTRTHGIVSLEIEGFFEQVGVDPARLYEAEIDNLIAQRLGR